MSGGEFSKGWKPLFSGVIGVATGASPIPFNVLPIVLGPIHYAMRWSFLEISIGITIYGILGALLAPAVGALADKFGVKPVAMLSLLGFGLAFSLLYFTPSNILGFYAMWALIGIVGIGSTPVTWSRTINRPFCRATPAWLPSVANIRASCARNEFSLRRLAATTKYHRTC